MIFYPSRASGSWFARAHCALRKRFLPAGDLPRSLSATALLLASLQASRLPQAAKSALRLHEGVTDHLFDT